MGNRSSNPKNKREQFLIRSVNLGKREGYEVKVIKHLQKLSILKKDNFSEWIRECIRLRYPEFNSPTFTAENLLQEMMLIQQKMSSLAQERERLGKSIRDMGLDFDLIEGKIITSNEPVNKQDSDSRENPDSDKKTVNNFY